MDRGGVGNKRGSKEMDGCPLTSGIGHTVSKRVSAC
jgi:hypothetical protein